MKYFLLETDEGNRNPYSINKNRAIDTRLLTKEGIGCLPMWNIVEMNFPEEGFFPDIICSPCILLSETFVKTVRTYQPDVSYKGVKLWDKESGINATYFITIIDELECMSDKTQLNSIGNRIVKLVLDENQIKGKPVFKVKGYDRKCIVGRLDFVESLLKRAVGGIKLTEIEICNSIKR